MTADRRLAEAVGIALGSEVVAAAAVAGGDVARAVRVDLADGRRVFAKSPPGDRAAVDTEAWGLTWLREAGAVHVPEVLAAHAGTDGGPAFLVLTWIERGPARPATDADLGRQLAALHDAGAPAFGRSDRRPTGSRGLPNEPYERWAEAYAANRLLPLARLARGSGALPTSTVAALEELAGRLDRLDDGQPPARLHGDLWAGNRIVDTSGRSWLVDPAAHGGHREFDLAMMSLFGGFSDACFRAYDEAHPLTPGWRERVSLHQIAPLVVHAIKFGGAYVPAAVEAVGRR